MRTLLFIILLFLYCSPAFTQIDSTEVLNDKIFDLLEDSELENEDGQYYEIIEQYLLTPIDLNKASLNDLLKLPFINFHGCKRNY